jgi:NADH/F420H2 dehydrogenase subunit C
MDVTAVDYLKFGASLSSAPSLSTPSPLPYYMAPKPMAEAWQRLPAAPRRQVRSAAQAGLVSNDEHRFDVVYHFYSSVHNHRLRVKVPLASSEPVVDSLTELWASANWYEREVWDMFGIRFSGHPNLKRILMYEEFEGHPLRKDYPVNKRQPLVGPIN